MKMMTGIVAAVLFSVGALALPLEAASPPAPPVSPPNSAAVSPAIPAAGPQIRVYSLAGAQNGVTPWVVRLQGTDPKLPSAAYVISGNQVSTGSGTSVAVNVSPTLVKAAYLGVRFTSADQTLQAQLKLPQGVGLVVNWVDPQGPAQTAGLQANDVIVMFGDQMAINPDQFEVLVRTHKAGEKIEVSVIREAQRQKFTVALAEKELPELVWMLNSNRSGVIVQPQTDLSTWYLRTLKSVAATQPKAAVGK